MTKSPHGSRQAQYHDPTTLAAIFDGPEFRPIRDACKVRSVDRRYFPTGKPGHEETVEEWGEVYTDASGIRARIFYYLQADGNAIRSIKRVVTNQGDYRLPMPNATNVSNLIANIQKQNTKKEK